MQLPGEWQPDPITATYRRLRTALLAHSGFVEQIRTNRRSPIGRFPDASDPKFHRVYGKHQPGDLPEIILLQSAYKLTPYGRNSLTCELEQTFDLTGSVEMPVVTDVNALKWEILVALNAAGGDLGLPGLVREWAITGAADITAGTAGSQQGGLGYVTLARIVVQMVLPRSLLDSLFLPQPL